MKEGFLSVLKQLIKEANFFTREELTEIQRMTSFNCQFKKSKELTDYPRKLSASRYLKLCILPPLVHTVSEWRDWRGTIQLKSLVFIIKWCDGVTALLS